MSGNKISANPQKTPVPLDDVKAFLRITDVNDDVVVDACIDAATRAAEDFTGRAFITQTWELALDAIPIDQETPLREGLSIGPDINARVTGITLPRAPLLGVTSVISYDDADSPTATTFASSKYYVDLHKVPGRIVLRTGQTWPVWSRVANGLVITYTAGYGVDPSHIPMPIRMAIRQLAGSYFDNPEAVVVGTISTELPLGARTMLQPYVLPRL